MGVLFLSPIQARAGDGGNAMANLALMKVALLTVAGAASVAKGASLIAAQKYPPGFAWLAGGIAELAGAAMAGGNNAQTEAETRTDERNFPDAGKGINESLTGGLSGGLPPGVSMASICKGASGTCTCNGTNCSNPQITIPSLTDVKGTLTNSYNSDPKSFPDGFSLQEALAKLDNEYGQAEQAVNSF
ncbi:MAG: hypothetical protein ABTQ25_04860, partial [Nitrosomonas ureae]